MSDITPAAERRGTLLVLSAPSGTGKTTLVQRLRQALPDLTVSVSATTRKPRRGEEEGVHYFFLTEPAFRARIASRDFLEHAEVHGNLYGTLRAPVDEQLALGRDVLLEIDVEGARQVRQAHPEARSIFILPPSRDELALRLAGRGLDEPEVIERRLRNAADEIARANEYDHAVINVDLDRAFEQLACIIASHGFSTRSQAAKIAGIQQTFQAGAADTWRP